MSPGGWTPRVWLGTWRLLGRLASSGPACGRGTWGLEAQTLPAASRCPCSWSLKTGRPRAAGTSEMALGRVLGRPRRDLEGDAVLAVQPTVLCTDPGSPWRSLPPILIEFPSRASPGPGLLRPLLAWSPLPGRE